MICDFVPNEYPIANLDSVVEARLNLFPSSWWHGPGHNGDPLSSDPTNLIKGLRNVKILKLMRPHTVAVSVLCCFLLSLLYITARNMKMMM